MLQPKYNSLSFPPTPLTAAFWIVLLFFIHLGNMTLFPRLLSSVLFYTSWSHTLSFGHLIYSEDFLVTLIDHWNLFVSPVWIFFDLLMKLSRFPPSPSCCQWSASLTPLHALHSGTSSLQEKYGHPWCFLSFTIHLELSIPALKEASWWPLLPWLCLHQSHDHFSTWITGRPS